MPEAGHTVLCVDDERNILSALRRLLRQEGYRLLTASSGSEGLDILRENEVHVVISDQRMPGMNGTEFLAKVKEEYPDTIRIILTGYTDVDSISESINRGHIYKFFLKPWNDQNLRLEIKQALEQYDLIRDNKQLHEKVLAKNEELEKINENLETLVLERTRDLEIQNQALELSRAVLEDLPVPVLGVSSEGMIVLVNRATTNLLGRLENMEIGRRMADCLPKDLADRIADVLRSVETQSLKAYKLDQVPYDIELVPLSGRFAGKGVIITMRPM